jgi:hypothetical protein
MSDIPSSRSHHRTFNDIDLGYGNSPTDDLRTILEAVFSYHRLWAILKFLPEVNTGAGSGNNFSERDKTCYPDPPTSSFRYLLRMLNDHHQFALQNTWLTQMTSSAPAPADTGGGLLTTATDDVVGSLALIGLAASDLF